MQPVLESLALQMRERMLKFVTDWWERRFDSVIAYECVWVFIITICHNTKNHKKDCLEFCRGQDFKADKILINKR
jgi:hypothetical protein